MKRVARELEGIVKSADWHIGTRYDNGGWDESASVDYTDGSEGDAYLYHDGLLVVYKGNKEIFRGQNRLPHARAFPTAWMRMCMKP